METSLSSPMQAKVLLLAGALLIGLSTAATTATARDGPCAGTPENNCRPLCETGDIRDCLPLPVVPCIYVEQGVVVCP